MTTVKLGIKEHYVTLWEMFFGITYLMTFTAFSVAGINVSDKICFGIIAIIPMLKWTKQWFDVLIRDYLVLVLWVTLPLLNLMFTDYPVKSFMYTVNYMLQIMVLVSFTIVFSVRRINYFHIFKFLYQIAVVCAIIGILQYYFFEVVTKVTSFFSEEVYERTWDGMHRVSSLYDNPNLFAVISACSFMIGIILWIYNHKTIYLIENIIIAYGLFCSKSRGPVIGIAFGIFVVVVLSFNSKYKISSNKRHFFIVMCGIIGVLLVIKLLQGVSRFDLVFQGIATGDWSLVTNKRTEIWANLLSYMPRHWMLGLGNGVSGDLSMEKFSEGFGAHSFYIGLLVETGLCGLILYVLFVILAYNNAKKYLQEPQERLCFFAIFSMFQMIQITEMLLDHLYQYVFLFWLIVAMPYSAKRKCIDEKRRCEG